MCQHHGEITLWNTEGDKQQKERYTYDDVAIKNRDIVDKRYRLSCSPVAQVMDANGSECAENSRYRGGYQCDGNRVDESCGKGMVGSLGKKVLVEL